MTVSAKTTVKRPSAHPRFNRRKYGRLLAQAAPAVIRNETELRRVEGEISKLLRKYCSDLVLVMTSPGLVRILIAR